MLSYSDTLVPSKQSNLAVLAGLRQYEKYKDQVENKKEMVVVDYTQPSYKRRLYLIDLISKEIVACHFVAHGSRSNCLLNKARCCYFSNNIGSRKSSLGAIKTGVTYYGQHGYSLKLHGLDPNLNSNIFVRFIVVHSAKYVAEHYIRENHTAGNSWGCLALDPSVSKELIDRIKNGTFVYNYFDV